VANAGIVFGQVWERQYRGQPTSCGPWGLRWGLACGWRICSRLGARDLGRPLLMDDPHTWRYRPWWGGGRCWGTASPYLRMAGGRGVSTTLGVVLGLDWRVGILAFVIFLFVLAVSHYISLGSMVATALVPVMFALIKPDAAGRSMPSSARGSRCVVG